MRSVNNSGYRSSDRPSSVLLIGPLPPPKGGISIHLERLSQALTRKSISFEVVNESRLPNQQVADFGVCNPVAYLRKLRQADVVHIHTGNSALRLLHALAARLLGARVLITLHSHRRLTGHKRYFRDICLRAACLVANGTVAVSRQIAKETGAKIVVPAFIGPNSNEEAIPADVLAWMNQQRQRRRKIVSMNAFNTSKMDGVDLYGLDLLVGAMSAATVAQNLAAIVCVSTDGPDPDYDNELSSRIQKAGMEERIWIRRGDISFAGVLQRSDIFVRPTVTDGDSLSVREALWYGLPTIASDAAERPIGARTFRSRDLEHFAQCLSDAANEDANPAANKIEFADEIISMYKTLAPQK